MCALTGRRLACQGPVNICERFKHLPRQHCPAGTRVVILLCSSLMAAEINCLLENHPLPLGKGYSRRVCPFDNSLVCCLLCCLLAWLFLCLSVICLCQTLAPAFLPIHKTNTSHGAFQDSANFNLQHLGKLSMNPKLKT